MARGGARDEKDMMSLKVHGKGEMMEYLGTY